MTGIPISEEPFSMRSPSLLYSRPASQPELDLFPLDVVTQAQWLVSQIGLELVCVATGQLSVVVVEKWLAEERAIPRLAAEVIQLLFRIVIKIESRYDTRTAIQFLSSGNGSLGGETPVLYIARTEIKIAVPNLCVAVKNLCG